MQLHQHRHTADYEQFKTVVAYRCPERPGLPTDAFTAWRAIGTQDAAQDSLLHLFLPKLPKQ